MIPFFQQLSERLHLDAKEVKAAVANALGISESGAYKKLQGITKLTMDEAEVIARRFGFAFDIALHDANPDHPTYAFMSDDIIRPPSGYMEWTSNILNHSIELEHHHKQHAYTFTSFQRDISFMHLFSFRPLLYFKLYVWSRTAWHRPIAPFFDLEYFRRDQALNTLLRQIERQAITYESREIWHVDFLQALLLEIDYYRRIGIFRSVDVVAELYASVDKLIQHLEQQSIAGCKSIFGKPEQGAALDLYVNRTHHSGNLIYITSAKNSITYTTFLEPNMIRSADPNVCAFSKSWLDQALAQSQQISATGESERIAFFQHQRELLARYKAAL